MHSIAKLVSSSWKLAITSNALRVFDASSVRQKSTLPTRLLANRVFSYSSAILTPVWDPLNAWKGSKKTYALQPEKVCTVIAMKECILRSVQMSKVTEAWWGTAKTVCSFGSNSIWCELCVEMMTWKDDERRIHRSTKSLFRCQKRIPGPSFKTKTETLGIETKT